MNTLQCPSCGGYHDQMYLCPEVGSAVEVEKPAEDIPLDRLMGMFANAWRNKENRDFLSKFFIPTFEQEKHAEAYHEKRCADSEILNLLKCGRDMANMAVLHGVDDSGMVKRYDAAIAKMEATHAEV